MVDVQRSAVFVFQTFCFEEENQKHPPRKEDWDIYLEWDFCYGVRPKKKRNVEFCVPKPTLLK